MKHARETRSLPHHLIAAGGRIAIVLLLASSVVAAGTQVQARTRVVRGAGQHSFRGRAASYRQTNLVSDISGLAATTDPNLVNPWGISHSTTSPFWISDNGTGVSTLYNGAGAKQDVLMNASILRSPREKLGLQVMTTRGATSSLPVIMRFNCAAPIPEML